MKGEDNPMREIRIQKLCINCCVGESGERLEKAAKVLKQITGQEPRLGKAKVTIRNFGIKRNEKISALVTVMGQKSKDILYNALKIKEFQLKRGCFSEGGNFGFGIKEHIDMGIKYDPSIGIFGMDFFVVLGRPGVRVSKRRIKRGRVGKKQRVTKNEAINWFIRCYDGHVS